MKKPVIKVSQSTYDKGVSYSFQYLLKDLTYSNHFWIHKGDKLIYPSMYDQLYLKH